MIQKTKLSAQVWVTQHTWALLKKNSIKKIEEETNNMLATQENNTSFLVHLELVQLAEKLGLPFFNLKKEF